MNSEALTALVKQYGDQEQFPRMIGTCGGMDYLIVAKDPQSGVQLGIKALIGLGAVGDDQAILCGFRLRAAYINPHDGPNNVTSIETEGEEKPEAKMPWEVFDFPWENTGLSNTGYRGSLIRTLPLARTAEDAGWVLDDLDHVRFFGKLAQFLHDKVPDELFVVTEEDIKNYLIASYYPALLGMQAAHGDPKKQLEALDLAWETEVKDHAAHEEKYQAARKELLAKIAEMDAGEEPTYHPKAHFGEEELVPLEGVTSAMLKGTKPKLSIVTGAEGEGSDSDQEDEAQASAFETAAEETEQPAEAQQGEQEQPSEQPVDEPGPTDEPPAAA